MELFKIFGTIAIQSADAEEGMNKAKDKAKETASSMEKSFSKIGDAAVKCGKIIATGLAAGGAAVGALVKKSLDGYAEYEQLVGGAKLMFGEAYDFIADKAKNAYATVQMSQNEYLQQVNGFAVGLKTALGGNEQAAAELADRIITAEADIVAATGNSQEAVQNAFNGIMKNNFSMLDNLGLGITATKEGMQEVIDKANAWNATQGKVTKYTIDNVADCQAALVDYVAMNDMAGYAGEEARNSIQGSMSMLKASWHNLLTGMAQDEADFDSLINNFVDSAGLAADNLMPRIEKALDGTASLVDKLAPIIVERIPKMIQNYLPKLTKSAVSIVQSLVNGIRDNSDAITETVLEVGEIIGASIMEMLPTIFELGLELVISLVTGIAENIDEIVAASEEMIDKIVETLTEPGMLRNLLDAALDIILALAEGLAEFLPELTSAACDIIVQLVGFLIEPENIIKIVEVGGKLIAAVGEGILKSIGNISESVEALVSKIIEIITSTDWLAVGAAIIEGIGAGIASAPSWSNGWNAVSMAKNGASVNAIAAQFAVNGSHASGLDYVPFDGYIAELHRGEMVVPADEASMLRGGSGNTMVQQMERMIDLWTQFMPEALTAMKTPMVCDTNGLAIAMAPTMDTELGRLAIKKGRGR